jgi:hypothetical protein
MRALERQDISMIARIWHGRVLASKSDAYLKHMRTFAIPRYKAVPGNLAAYALMRIEGEVAHFDMLTFWESVEAIKAFAGENAEKARYDDFDKDYLLEYEPTCRHWQAYEG